MPFPTKAQWIDAAETALGLKLPAEFRAYLVASNGGEVETENDTWEIHPVLDASDRKRVARSANHILRETTVAREWPGFPSGAVAIGTNGTGDRLVFLPAAHDPTALDERVFRWDHETGEALPLAENFSAFCRDGS